MRSRSVSSTVKLFEASPLAGLVLMVGAQTYGLASSALRYSVMGLGMGFVVIFSLLHLRLMVARPRLFLGWLALVTTGEIFNIANSAFPWDIKAAGFRVVCYLFTLGGIIMGLRQRVTAEAKLDWSTRTPIVVAWILVAGAVVLYWRNVHEVEAFTAASRFGYEDMNPVGIAFGLGTCMAVAIALLMYDSHPLFRLINASILLIAARGLLFTGSRGALLSFISVTTVLIVIRNRFSTTLHRVLFFIGAVMLVGGVVAWLTFSSFAEEQAQFYLARIGWLSSGQDLAANERLVIWQRYAEQFHSWALLGYGGYSGEYPHNFFYEFWLRFGLLGLFGSLFAVWVITRSLVLLWRQPLSPLTYAMFGVLFFGFLNAQTNLALEFNRAFWLGIGFAVTLVFRAETREGLRHAGPRLGRIGTDSGKPMLSTHRVP